MLMLTRVVRSDQEGGGINNDQGSLSLIRCTCPLPLSDGSRPQLTLFCSICSPTFSGNKADKATYGPNCHCFKPKLCVGCTCHTGGSSKYPTSYCP